MSRNCMNQGTMNQGMMGPRPVSMNRPSPNGCGCDPNGRGPQNQMRTAQGGGSCGEIRNSASQADQIPNSCRAELLRFLNEVSFAAYDSLLYLDTHPDCQEGMQYFQKYRRLRDEALKIHAASYGPLTLSTAGDSGCSSFEWTMQPWPWELEGGAC